MVVVVQTDGAKNKLETISFQPQQKWPKFRHRLPINKGGGAETGRSGASSNVQAHAGTQKLSFRWFPKLSNHGWRRFENYGNSLLIDKQLELSIKKHLHQLCQRGWTGLCFPKQISCRECMKYTLAKIVLEMVKCVLRFAFIRMRWHFPVENLVRQRRNRA